jgi:hypothetical protein
MVFHGILRGENGVWKWSEIWQGQGCMKNGHTLSDLYRFPGFRALGRLKGIWGDSHARVIRLIRRAKKRFAVVVAAACGVFTTSGLGKSGI